jgi:tetratricopeptide (TPR) repeat protein
MLYYARRYDEAVEQGRRALEMDPGFTLARRLVGLAYLGTRQFPAAIQELEAAARGDRRADSLAMLGFAYGTAGRTQESRKVLEELEQAAQGRRDMDFSIAAVLASLGEKDRAFAWLEKAYQNHEGGLILLKVDSVLDPLRSDPRFEDLERRVFLLR